MPQSHIFEVEMPGKSVLEIDAPEDTPIESIKARAKQYQDTQAIKSAQAAKYPTAAEGGKPDLPWYAGYFNQGSDSSRTAAQVATDQAANVIKGIPQAVTGIPGTVAQLAKMGMRAATGFNPGQTALDAADMASGATAPIVTPIKGSLELAGPYIQRVVKSIGGRDLGPIEDPETGLFTAPSDADWSQAAQGAGAMLGGAALAGATHVPEIQSAAAKVADVAGNAFDAVKSKVVPFVTRPGLDAPTINRWMDIPAKEVAHGANPGQQLLDEKLLGATKEATRANVKTALTDAGSKMESELKAATAKGIEIDAQTPTYDAVANATKKIGSPRDAAFQAQMNGIVDDIEAAYPDLHKLSPLQAQKLKVHLGDSIKWSGQAYDTPANQAMIQIYRDLNSQLKTQVPGIAPVQSRWGNLYIASKNLAESMADDVVGKGTGAGVPPQPLSPAMQLGKMGLKYAPWVAGTGIAGKMIRDAIH